MVYVSTPPIGTFISAFACGPIGAPLSVTAESYLLKTNALPEKASPLESVPQSTSSIFAMLSTSPVEAQLSGGTKNIPWLAE